LWAGSNLPVPVAICVCPEQQISNWEAPVHRIKQIAYLRGRPNKRPLNIRQPDFAHVYVFNQFGKRVLHFFEERCTHRAACIALSTCLILTSPDSSLGRSASRKVPSVRDSILFVSIRSSSGAMIVCAAFNIG